MDVFIDNVVEKPIEQSRTRPSGVEEQHGMKGNDSPPKHVYATVRCDSGQLAVS